MEREIQQNKRINLEELKEKLNLAHGIINWIQRQRIVHGTSLEFWQAAYGLELIRLLNQASRAGVSDAALSDQINELFAGAVYEAARRVSPAKQLALGAIILPLAELDTDRARTLLPQVTNEFGRFSNLTRFNKLYALVVAQQAAIHSVLGNKAYSEELFLKAHQFFRERELNERDQPRQSKLSFWFNLAPRSIGLVRSKNDRQSNSRGVVMQYLAWLTERYHPDKETARSLNEGLQLSAVDQAILAIRGQGDSFQEGVTFFAQIRAKELIIPTGKHSEYVGFAGEDPFWLIEKPDPTLNRIIDEIASSCIDCLNQKGKVPDFDLWKESFWSRWRGYILNRSAPGEVTPWVITLRILKTLN